MTTPYHYLNIKGMERIKTVPQIIPIASSKNAVLNCIKKLAWRFPQKILFYFPCKLVSPLIDFLDHKEMMQHGNIESI